MEHDYILGAAIGGLVAFIFSVPAIVLELTERGKVSNIPLIVDVKTIFGYTLKKQEVFWVGLLLHIIMGTLFGLVYVLFVLKGWLVFTNLPYSFGSLFIFALCAWIVSGVIIFPSLGMGLFGRKEGKRVWVELLASMFILGTSMWLLVKFYQPFFFNY